MVTAVQRPEGVTACLDLEVGRLNNLPVTEKAALFEAAALVGIDVSRYSLENTEEIGKAIFEKAVAPLKEVLTKEVGQLTQRDLVAIQQAYDLADRLMIINNLADPDTPGVGDPLAKQFRFSVCPHGSYVAFKLPAGLNFSQALETLFDEIERRGGERVPAREYFEQHRNSDSPAQRRVRVYPHVVKEPATRSEQERQICSSSSLMEIVSPWELAIVDSLMKIEMGEQLLTDKAVRTTDGARLQYDSKGRLTVAGDAKDERHETLTTFAIERGF